MFRLHPRTKFKHITKSRASQNRVHHSRRDYKLIPSLLHLKSSRMPVTSLKCVQKAHSISISRDGEFLLGASKLEGCRVHHFRTRKNSETVSMYFNGLKRIFRLINHVQCKENLFSWDLGQSVMYAV